VGLGIVELFFLISFDVSLQVRNFSGEQIFRLGGTKGSPGQIVIDEDFGERVGDLLS